jgi:hypothetical protein
LTDAYPYLTPYQYAGCEPIVNADLDGAEPEDRTKAIGTSSDGRALYLEGTNPGLGNNGGVRNLEEVTITATYPLREGSKRAAGYSMSILGSITPKSEFYHLGTDNTQSGWYEAEKYQQMIKIYTGAVAAAMYIGNREKSAFKISVHSIAMTNALGSLQGDGAAFLERSFAPSFFEVNSEAIDAAYSSISSNGSGRAELSSFGQPEDLLGLVQVFKGLGVGVGRWVMRGAAEKLTFGQKLFLSENFGITSERFANSITGVKGTWNNQGGLFKMGWSTQSKYGGGMQLRIGIGSKASNPNQAWKHIYIPKTFVPNSFVNPSIQVKKSLFKL